MVEPLSLDEVYLDITDKALSTCRTKEAKDHRPARPYAAAAASRHTFIAAARKARWVGRVVR